MKKISKAIIAAFLLLIPLLKLETPSIKAEVVGQDGKEIEMYSGGGWLFLHGNAIILDEGATPDLTKVYKDVNANKSLDDEDELLAFNNVNGTKENGYDLSNTIIYALGSSEPFDPSYYTEHTGDIVITMLGGSVKEINGSLFCDNTGDFTFTMTGGTIGMKIVPTGSATVWNGNIDVQIGGNAKINQAVYGGSENGGCQLNGNVHITIKDNVIIGSGYANAGVFAGGQQPNDIIMGTSTIDIQNGTINGLVAADLYATTFRDKVTINIEDAVAINNVCGIFDTNSVANNVEINVKGGTLLYNLIGTKGLINTANININGGTFNNAVVGINGGSADSVLLHITNGQLNAGLMGHNNGVAKNITIDYAGGIITDLIAKNSDNGTVENIALKINGGTISGSVALKAKKAITGLKNGTIEVEGSPIFTTSGKILLRENEFISAAELFIDNSVQIQSENTAIGTLLVKPLHDSVKANANKFKVINANSDIVYGDSIDTANNLYLGNKSYLLNVNENADFKNVWVDHIEDAKDVLIKIKNNGNSMMTLKNIEDTEYFTFTYDKNILYPQEIATLTIHLKNTPSITNGTKNQNYQFTENITILENSLQEELKILMNLLKMGNYTVEEMVPSDVTSNMNEIQDQLFTDEDKDALKNGDDILLKLIVKDIDNTINDEIKQKLLAYSDYELGQFLDIHIEKYINNIIVNDLNVLPAKIKIVIDIPEELRKQGRTFYLLRMHNNPDGTEVISEIADMDDNDNTFTFETNQFSTYAIVYTDNKSNKPSVETNDNSHIQFYSLLAFYSLLFIGYGIKKNYKKVKA